jgi:hypothetical protein
MGRHRTSASNRATRDFNIQPPAYLNSERLVNQVTSFYQENPTEVALDDGASVEFYDYSVFTTKWEYLIYGRRLSQANIPVGNEVSVSNNGFPAYDSNAVRVSATKVMVVYGCNVSGTDNICARTFNTDLTGGDTQTRLDTGTSQKYYPQVKKYAEGNAVVAYSDNNGSVYYVRYTSGSILKSQTAVAGLTAYDYHPVGLDVFADGGMAITATDGQAIRVQLVKANDTLDGSVINVTDNSKERLYPSIVAIDNSRLAISWQEKNADNTYSMHVSVRDRVTHNEVATFTASNYNSSVAIQPTMKVYLDSQGNPVGLIFGRSGEGNDGGSIKQGIYGGVVGFDGTVLVPESRISATEGDLVKADVIQLGDRIRYTWSGTVSGDSSYTGVASRDVSALIVSPVDNSTITCTEDQAQCPLKSINIQSAYGNSATVTLTLSNPLAGTISTGTSNAVTSTYNPTTGVWQASGALADVNFLASNATFTPNANYNGVGTISVVITDTKSTVSDTWNYNVAAVNDAPVIANAGPHDAPATKEVAPLQTRANAGTAVGTLISTGAITDADLPAAAKAVAITGITGHCEIQAAPDGVTFSKVEGASKSSATFVDAATKLRAVPDACYSGTDCVAEAVACDTTLGASAGSQVNVTAVGQGGSAPCSTGSLFLRFPITAVDFAPVVGNDVNPPPINAQQGTVATRGVKVSDIIAAENPSIPCGSTEGLGMVITSADEKSKGSFQYSLDDGVTWNNFVDGGDPAISSTSALALPADALIDFRANSDLTSGSFPISYLLANGDAVICDGRRVVATTTGSDTGINSKPYYLNIVSIPHNYPPEQFNQFPETAVTVGERFRKAFEIAQYLRDANGDAITLVGVDGIPSSVNVTATASTLVADGWLSNAGLYSGLSRWTDGNGGSLNASLVLRASPADPGAKIDDGKSPASANNGGGSVNSSQISAYSAISILLAALTYGVRVWKSMTQEKTRKEHPFGNRLFKGIPIDGAADFGNSSTAGQNFLTRIVNPLMSQLSTRLESRLGQSIASLESTYLDYKDLRARRAETKKISDCLKEIAAAVAEAFNEIHASVPKCTIWANGIPLTHVVKFDLAKPESELRLGEIADQAVHALEASKFFDSYNSNTLAKGEDFVSSVTGGAADGMEELATALSIEGADLESLGADAAPRPPQV